MEIQVTETLQYSRTPSSIRAAIKQINSALTNPKYQPPAVGCGGLIPKYAKHLGLITLLDPLQRDFLSVT